MNIIVLGLNHRSAPVELRELLAIPDSRMGEALSRLMAYAGIKEAMFLGTCNRVEVYAVVEGGERGFRNLEDFLVSTHFSLSSDELLPHLYHYSDDEAIGHLFRVAASLDSMVVGEPQILGQVKEAYEMALTHRSSGVILNKLVKKAISVGKSVRTNTRIGEYAVSVSYAAVELAKKVFSNLKQRTVLLVGAGEMGKLAARHLVTQGVKEVLLTTRNHHRALALAERFNGHAVPYEHLGSILPKADIIICATGAPHYVIAKEDIESAVHQRMNRPIFLIDITVPRNIDPGVKDVDNAFLFDIDDLKAHVGHNQEERLREAEKAERYVQQEVSSILSWVHGLEATPTIVALRKKAEQIKHLELEKVFNRLGDLSPKDRMAIEGLASSIVNKLLHGPLVTLKAEAQSQNGFAFIEAARRFFELKEQDIQMVGHETSADETEMLHVEEVSDESS
ncbi:MAG: glutamyl-tRNA reductase [Nitrospira sp.]|nr:glutamyl-tRNA reductase [Nitrospira sp.]MCB9709769.1 glutamyl-tRNA reductase [Nitrospiraceae bacterium]MDR4486069.1 glutamyl-tRNA reductase [Nitrospirales bacterium]MCA9476658.1 glutamyl-tRNA reductase [Nitrospira sp.]MCA9481090.1 glutamyl-tRNA reductase [Nitrospira sp.]